MQLNFPIKGPIKGQTVCGVFAVALLAVNAAPALAYMGPGLGLGAIGTALGVVAALLLALLSIVWYPMKRLLRRMREDKAAQPAARKLP